MRTPQAHRATTGARAPGRRLPAALGLAALVASTILACVPLGARGDAAEGNAAFLEQLRQQRQERAAADTREFARLLQHSRLLLQQRRYEQARSLLRRARLLRPDDPTAQRLLAQVDAASGRGSAQPLLDALRDEQSFKNRTLLRQLEHDLFAASQALQAGQHRRALDYADRVLTGVDYVADPAKAGPMRTRAQKLSAAARKADAQATAEQRQADVAAVRQLGRRRKTDELVALRKRGWKLHESGQHQQALAVADEMLRLAPGNKQALFLRQEARRATDRDRDVPALRAERKKAERDTLVRQIEEEMTPPKGIGAKIVLPAKNPRPTGSGPAPLERPLERWEQELRAKLREPITIEFKHTTVREACHYLSELTGCPILVDPSVARQGSPFSLPKMTVSFEHVLRWLCRFSRVTYAVRDHAILVTSRGGGRFNHPVLRDYDLSGLLVPTRAVKTTFSGGVQRDTQAPPHAALALPGATSADPTRSASEDEIGEGWVQFIRTTVAAESWGQPTPEGGVLQEQPRYTITYRNGRIVVRHTPEVQRQIEEMLNNFRRARNLQVHILTRFIQLDLDFLASMDLDLTDSTTVVGPYGLDTTTGFDSQPAGANPRRWHVLGELINDSEVPGLEDSVTSAGGLSLNYSYLGSDAVNAVLNAVIKHRRGTLLIAPRLTCFNTQRANFQAVTNYNYVRSISSDNEPEIGNIPDGIIFDVQPFVSADHRYITLVLQPQLRTWLGFLQFQYAVGLNRIIQVPTTELKSIATTLTVPDGGTVLVGGLAEANEAAGVAGVPIISGIPLLRYLFRSWTEAESRRSLVVLVTAEIVPDIFEE